MMWMCSLAMSAMMLAMMQTNHPLKMSIIILAFSAIMLSTLTQSTGSVWIPSIFFLLFMGGILVMFSIISSLIPNMKPKMMKLSWIASAMMVMVMPKMNSFIDKQSQVTKGELSSKYFLVTISLVMGLYFINMVEVLKKEEMPMRSYLC